MRRSVTINDVAKKVNVSKSTISQYLNKRYEYMSLETKEKIDAAIKELGFRPNVLARGLKQKKSHTIGIILPTVLYSFSSQVARAIEDCCYSHGYHVIVCNSDDDPAKEKEYIGMLLDKQVDGIISLPTGYNREVYEELVKNEYPIILLGRRIKDLAIDIVVFDNITASYRATDHFIQQGHTRIAIIIEPVKKQSPRFERLEGYKKALSDNKIPLRKSYVLTIPVTAIQDSLDGLFSLKHPPTAFLLGNDLILKELLKYSKQRKIKIPQQMSIIVFDQNPYLDLLDPPISSISQPTFGMGKKAAEILLQKIRAKTADGHGSPEEYVFEGRLEIRESSGAHAGRKIRTAGKGT